MINLPINIDYTGKVVVVTGAGGLIGSFGVVYHHSLECIPCGLMRFNTLC